MYVWQPSNELWRVQKIPPSYRQKREENARKPLGVYGGDMRLDITKHYEYQDKSENFWRFTFESIAGEEGWFAWIRRPNSEEYFCVGKILPSDLIRRLEEIPPPLSTDDLIDLELWIKNGGLDQYKPKRTRRKKTE